MFENLFNLNNTDSKPMKNLFDKLGTEELNTDSYKNYKKHHDNKLHLFMFYAPWCGHCKRKHTFLKELNNHKKHIKIHTYNCEMLKDTDKNGVIQNIQGYPTFKMGYNQKIYDVELVEFMIAAVAIATKVTIESAIRQMIEHRNLNDDLKSELKNKEDEIKNKLKNLKK